LSRRLVLMLINLHALVQSL